jgi:hypothetical protein
MTRTDLHGLVDELPDASVEVAAVYLERAKDPVLAALDAAPLDDEPYPDAERAADATALAAYRRGECTPIEDLIAELDRPTTAAG